MKRIGSYTIQYENNPLIAGFGSVAGKKEGEGPLSQWFHKIENDTKLGCETWEQAESKMQSEAIELALERALMQEKDVQIAFGGDLLNQCISTSYSLRGFGIPFLGQYGACSTMGQGLIMSAVYTESGAAKNAVCSTSSHFCAAERQYRFPLEYGAVRTPTAQWTVTGAGSCVVGMAETGVSIKAATVGKITDYQITDPNNMGAAMAPAICIIEP